MLDSTNIYLSSSNSKNILKSLNPNTEAAKAVHLHTQVYAFEAVEQVHVNELNTLKQKNAAFEDEEKSLNGKVAELQSLVSVKDRELKDVDATMTSLKSQNDGLADQNLTERLEEFQNAELKVVNERVEKLDADLMKMACHLEEKFYPHLLTTISCRRWLLTHSLKLVLVRCLNSSEYLIALGVAISRSIKKGMQDGLAAGIDYGRAGRSLADIVAYNPTMEADYNSALQELHEPDVEQLRVPIHKSEDQVVLGETSLSFALSVSHSRMEWIRANITVERSALLGVWTPLSEPLSI
ncbi:hypothetical protein Tco_1261469 [Tanacetum coccineum]